MKSRLFTGIAAALALGAVSACGSSAPAPAADTPSADLVVSNARLMLAPVKGNPAAAYFDIANKGGKDWMINDAAFAGASSAMLHTVGGANMGGGMGEVLQVPVRQGETVHFEPGHLHVMVMDPPAGLAPGGKGQLTLKFLGGDALSFPVEVKAPGDER